MKVISLRIRRLLQPGSRAQASLVAWRKPFILETPPHFDISICGLDGEKNGLSPPCAAA